MICTHIYLSFRRMVKCPGILIYTDPAANPAVPLPFTEQEASLLPCKRHPGSRTCNPGYPAAFYSTDISSMKACSPVKKK